MVEGAMDASQYADEWSKARQDMYKYMMLQQVMHSQLLIMRCLEEAFLRTGSNIASPILLQTWAETHGPCTSCQSVKIGMAHSPLIDAAPQNKPTTRTVRR